MIFSENYEKETKKKRNFAVVGLNQTFAASGKQELSKLNINHSFNLKKMNCKMSQVLKCLMFFITVQHLTFKLANFQAIKSHSLIPISLQKLYHHRALRNLQQPQQQQHQQNLEHSRQASLSRPFFRYNPTNLHRPASDRRTSSLQQQQQQQKQLSNQNQQQQQQPPKHHQVTADENDGKLLVCYYTTRHSAHRHWPKNAREFVVAPDSLLGNPVDGAVQSASFVPNMVQYEPFVQASSENNIASANSNDNNTPLSNSLQQQFASEYSLANNGKNSMKNQQQQLLFKSAAIQVGLAQNQGQSQSQNVKQNLLGGPKAGDTRNEMSSGKQFQLKQQQLSFNNSNSNNNNNNANELTQHQSHQVKSKTPTYHFIEDSSMNSFDNGVIVGNGITAASGGNNIENVLSTLQATTMVGSPMSLDQVGGGGGNNGFNEKQQANYIMSNNNRVDHINNSPSNPERNSLTALKQQLVFPPSQAPSLPPLFTLNRAFIVNGATGGSKVASSNGLAAATAASNQGNQALEAKSQLFISSPLNRFSQQAGDSATVSTLNQQQQHQSKGKSLQFPATSVKEQLSPIAHSINLPGAISSSIDSFPLSPATLLSNQQQNQDQSYRNLHQQQAFDQASLNAVGGQLAFQKSQLSDSSASSSYIDSSNLNGKAAPVDFKNGHPNYQRQQTTILTNLTNGISSGTSLSSVLGASPFSSVLDVFGAASQYLMRFKPSSLISPASLAFNTISNIGEQNLNQNQQKPHQPSYHSQFQQHQLNKLGNSSAAAVAALSSSVGNSKSTISLPYSTVFNGAASASQQKSSDERTSSHGGSSSNGSGYGGNGDSFSSNNGSSTGESSFDGSSATGSAALISRFTLGQNDLRREEVCGRTIQTPQRRIIGGEGARYGEFPYQVHIKIAKHQCGGALVDKQSIVTAAHCVYHFITRAPVSKLQIVIGAYDIEDEQYQELPPQYFKVNKVKLHPNFRFSASHPDRYDIAILKLDKPVKYTDNVLPVCLPPPASSAVETATSFGGSGTKQLNSNSIKFENMIGTVTGFGKTDPSLSNRYGTRLLQKVDVPIIENNECERWHRTRGIDLKIFPEMMCAGYEDGLKDACVGDSGGPLVVKTASGPDGSFRWTLAGITSAGFGCAQSRQPGIYHRVSHTVKWILENLD